MALHVYNVRTRKLEPFAPLKTGGVGVYVCGLTVYDHTHVGHARTAVSFEVIRRWLEHRAKTEGWGRVKFVQNVTDVDDKIIARAKEHGVSPREHAERWDEECAAQMKRLGVREPDEAPHVTTSIPDIVKFIAGIVANGYAYATRDGNVYFDVPKYQAHAAREFPACGYGSLSNRDYREMAAGTRKEVEGDKKHPADFALWKSADPGDHPDANWDSSWGRGRPGWHIECSLMSTRALGDQIDIHGGGQDLIFPHHENEIAQSQAKTGKAPFVNVWLHSGFLNVEGEKMSKSLHNFITLKDALDELETELPKRGINVTAADALRFYYLQTHYRSKIDFQRKALYEAASALHRLERLLGHLSERAQAHSIGCADLDVPMLTATTRLRATFDKAMDDDFHTPAAIASFSEFQREANRLLDAHSATTPLGSDAARQARTALERCGRLLTLFPDVFFTAAGGAPESLVQAAIAAGVTVGAESELELKAKILEFRAKARAAKDWRLSDKIRDELGEAGYIIEDTKSGEQRWRRA